MATKLAPKKKLPKVVYIWRDDEGFIIATEEVDDLPDGAHVGQYELGNEYTVKVETSLDPA